MDGGEGGDGGGGGRGERGGLLAAGSEKDDEGAMRCGRGEYRGEVGDERASSLGCDIEAGEVGWGGKGETGGDAEFAVSRGDLVRRSGATLSPFVALVTKLVDGDGEFEVGVESCDAPDMESGAGEINPDVDCDIGGGLERDLRSLSIVFEEDKVGTGLVLDEACPEPNEEEATSPLDKNDSSLSRQSSASENVVEAALDVDAAEYAEDTETDAVNSCARPLERSCSLVCSGEEGYECMSGDRGVRLAAELPGRGSEEAVELPGRTELELSALIPLKLSDHDGDTLSIERERESATASDPRFAMIGRLSFP